MLKVSDFKGGNPNQPTDSAKASGNVQSASEDKAEELSYELPEIPDELKAHKKTTTDRKVDQIIQKQVDEGVPVFMSDEERKKHETYERYGLTHPKVPDWDDFL